MWWSCLATRFESRREIIYERGTLIIVDRRLVRGSDEISVDNEGWYDCARLDSECYGRTYTFAWVSQRPKQRAEEVYRRGRQKIRPIQMTTIAALNAAGVLSPCLESDGVS